MPVVSRSDCTQTNVKEYYSFSKSANAVGFTSTIDSIKLQFQACQGANNNNNDLSAFVQQLVNDGKLSTAEQNIFKERVVGKNQCSSAVNSLLDKSGFEKGYLIDDTKWTHVVSENFDDQISILNYKVLQEMVEALEVPIVRRVCPSCTQSHKDIYYRRLTPMPEGFNLLDTLMSNWFDTNNVLNVDFSLHSTYLDAFYGTNGWEFCNYNDAGIGFPRDCGPTKRVNNQWNSYVRGGGNANHHAFLIPANPDFKSKIQHPVFPFILGTDYILQQGTRSSGTTVTYFDNNDYMVYTSANFGPPGTTKGILVNYNKGNEGGKLEIRLGAATDGELIAEMKPARVYGGWGADPDTAYVGLLKDVDGVHDITLVGKDSSGVMNLFSFELSEFSDRDATLKRIDAREYSTQSGTTVGSDFGVGWYDNNDFLTYSNINFGSAGTTTGIRLRYAKNNNGGKVEIRLDGPEGPLLATFTPSRTGGWYTFVEGYVSINGVSGVHDLSFVGKDAGGVLNLLWFELTDEV